jgi:hypothetical protein
MLHFNFKRLDSRIARVSRVCDHARRPNQGGLAVPQTVIVSGTHVVYQTRTLQSVGSICVVDSVALGWSVGCDCGSRCGWVGLVPVLIGEFRTGGF